MYTPCNEQTRGHHQDGSDLYGIRAGRKDDCPGSRAHETLDDVIDMIDGREFIGKKLDGG